MRVGRTPDSTLQSIVEANERPYTVYRRQDDADSTYGPDNDEYSPLTNTRPIYLYGEDERTEVTPAGEATYASLSGYVRDGVDVVEDDRIDFGGRRYEIEQQSPVYDNSGNVIVHQITLRRI